MIMVEKHVETDEGELTLRLSERDVNVQLLKPTTADEIMRASKKDKDLKGR